jgi:hypothetical protein
MQLVPITPFSQSFYSNKIITINQNSTETLTMLDTLKKGKDGLNLWLE